MRPLPTAIARLIEAALNHYIDLDPVAREHFVGLQGKVLSIELRDLQLNYYLLPEPGRLRVQGVFDGDSDAVIAGSSLALLRMGLAEDASHSLFSGEVEIRGDAELGQQLRRALDAVDIDWEEHLAQLVGDVVAHRATNVARDALLWGKDTLKTLLQDGAEYLQEESEALPRTMDTEEFLGDVDLLRDDVDRLAARVKRLQKSLDDIAPTKP